MVEERYSTHIAVVLFQTSSFNTGTDPTKPDLFQLDTSYNVTNVATQLIEKMLDAFELMLASYDPDDVLQLFRCSAFVGRVQSPDFQELFREFVSKIEFAKCLALFSNDYFVPHIFSDGVVNGFARWIILNYPTEATITTYSNPKNYLWKKAHILHFEANFHMV